MEPVVDYASSGSHNKISIKGMISLLMENVDGEKRVISLGMGDPSVYTCFKTSVVAEEAVVDALRSGKFNGYSPIVGLPQTRKVQTVICVCNQTLMCRAGRLLSTCHTIYLTNLTPDDVYVTSGCTQAIDVSLSMLARPGANILLPKPGFPVYDLIASFRSIEIRNYDLLPDRDWEVDLESVEALADHNTIALAIINPGNPCGSVFSYQHLKKIAEVAKKLNLVVIADEVYGHLAFGSNPFVPMGVFGSMLPVLTLGSMSKRWIVPGWRLGWFVTTDPCGAFKQPKVVERMKKYFDTLGGPATFVQAATPTIIEQTEEIFFKKTLNMLKHNADVVYKLTNEIPCISCLHKPQGAMSVMVKLNLSMLEDISDDVDFCFKLAKEESVIVVPGVTVGLKNWIRITFSVDLSSLEEALRRIKSFCPRHSSQLEQ